MDNKEEQSDDRRVLDLSKHALKKIPKNDGTSVVKHLILNDNELTKFDNIDSFIQVEKLSLSKNSLLRMYGVGKLHNLRELNLSYNGIITLEGTKELIHLRYLNLEGNNIKSIEHLHTNTKLEFLNLSDNSISIITDLSFLKFLKELNLQGNKISHLRQCEKYLPVSLEVLTLARNQINDLNEIGSLAHLSNLNSITIANNPCVVMTNTANGFDYRPFVLNWVMSVKIIDGFVVNPIESLKAEWLYSQGRGRQFRVGEQDSLAKYLSSVCPLSGEALENENERKLRLILSKAQQHQRQLQEQISDPSPNSTNSSPSTLRRKGLNRVQSPRFSRLSGGGRHKSPDSMSNSYHGSIMTNSLTSGTETSLPQLEMTKSLIENFTSDISQSIDGGSPKTNGSHENSAVTPPKSLPCHFESQSLIISSGPLAAASKMVPVPESLMSPDCPTTTIAQRVGVISATPHIPKPVVTNKQATAPSPVSKIKTRGVKTPQKLPKAVSKSSSPVLSPRKIGTPRSSISSPVVKESPLCAIKQPPADSDDESEHIQREKLKGVHIAAEKSQKQKQNAELIVVSKTTENSAILIQKIWRGYCTRKRNHLADKIQRKKTQNYILKLTKDMEETKVALENERKIQQLQMQAINSLWKKVSALQAQQTTQQFTPTATTPSQALFEESLRSATVSLNFDNQSVNVVQDLTKTCSMLMTQVAQLQNSMQDMVSCLTMFQPPSLATPPPIAQPRNAIETQTEIVAVHTPQVEQPAFPFSSGQSNSHKLLRPSSLPISCSSTDTSPKNLRLRSDVDSITDDLTEKVVISLAGDDSNRIDNEPVSELESEKHDSIVTEMEKAEGEDETIADASSLCTEN